MKISVERGVVIVVAVYIIINIIDPTSTTSVSNVAMKIFIEILFILFQKKSLIFRNIKSYLKMHFLTAVVSAGSSLNAYLIL